MNDLLIQFATFFVFGVLLFVALGIGLCAIFELLDDLDGRNQL